MITNKKKERKNGIKEWENRKTERKKESYTSRSEKMENMTLISHVNWVVSYKGYGGTPDSLPQQTIGECGDGLCHINVSREVERPLVQGP